MVPIYIPPGPTLRTLLCMPCLRQYISHLNANTEQYKPNSTDALQTSGSRSVRSVLIFFHKLQSRHFKMYNEEGEMLKIILEPKHAVWRLITASTHSNTSNIGESVCSYYIRMNQNDQSFALVITPWPCTARSTISIAWNS